MFRGKSIYGCMSYCLLIICVITQFFHISSSLPEIPLRGPKVNTIRTSKQGEHSQSPGRPKCKAKIFIFHFIIECNSIISGTFYEYFVLLDSDLSSPFCNLFSFPIFANDEGPSLGKGFTKRFMLIYIFI